MPNSHIRLEDLQMLRDRTLGKTDEFSLTVVRLLKNYVLNTDKLNAIEPKYEELLLAENEHAAELEFLNAKLDKLNGGVHTPPPPPPKVASHPVENRLAMHLSAVA